MDTAPAIVSLIHPHLSQPMYGALLVEREGGIDIFGFAVSAIF